MRTCLFLDIVGRLSDNYVRKVFHNNSLEHLCREYDTLMPVMSIVQHCCHIVLEMLVK